MKAFLNWIFLSSVDADKISTTIKGLAGFIPSLVVFLSLIHVHVTPDSIQGVLDGLVLFIAAITGVIGALVTLIGAVRKVWTSLAGTNAVINSR